MLDVRADRPDRVPNRAGVGYKAQHLDGILQDPDSVGWLEIHAENYMGDGGRPSPNCATCANNFPFPALALACQSVPKARWMRTIWPG